MNRQPRAAVNATLTTLIHRADGSYTRCLRRMTQADAQRAVDGWVRRARLNGWPCARMGSGAIVAAPTPLGAKGRLSLQVGYQVDMVGQQWLLDNRDA